MLERVMAWQWKMGYKEAQGTSEGNRNILYLDCGAYTNVSICQNPSNGTLRMSTFCYMQIIFKSYKEKNVRHNKTG